MPPPKNDDLTLRSFVKEFYRAPIDVPRSIKDRIVKDVIGFYDKDFKQNLTTLQVRATISDEVDEAIISTFVAGGQEALLDVKGVNTKVDLTKLISEPLQTLQKLNQQTRNDIMNLDELAGDRRSDVLEALTKGNLTTVKGSEVLKPQNLGTRVAKGLGISVVDTEDLVDVGGIGGPQSKIKLVQAIGADRYEDRQVWEQGTNREASYKAYRDLSGQLTALSGYMESATPRSIYHTGSITAYNRAVASELGINLDDVLKVKERRGINPATGRPGIYESKGAFSQTFQEQAALHGITNANDAFNDILNNDAKLRKALGLGDAATATAKQNAIWDNLTGENKEFSKAFLRSEFVNQGLYQEKLKDAAGAEFASAFELDVPQLSDANLFSVPNLAAPRPAIPAGSPPGTPQPPRPRIVLESEKQLLKKGYLDRLKTQRALEAELQAKLHQPEVLAGISNAAKTIVGEAELAKFNSLYAIPGDTPFVSFADTRIPTTLNAEVGAATTRINSAGAIARDRIMAATRSSKIANNLFFASTTKEILESIESKKFIEVVLLSSKMLNVLPFTDPRWGTVSEYVKYLDKINIIGNTRKLNGFIGTATGLAFEAGELKDLKLISRLAPKKLFEAETYVSWRQGPTNNAQWTQTAIKIVPDGAPAVTSGFGLQKSNGLFGDYSLYDVLDKSWGKSTGAGGQLLLDCGFANIADFDPDYLLADLDRARNFMDELRNAGNSIVAGNVPTTSFEILAEGLGLTTAEKVGKLSQNITNLNTPNAGGFALLEYLSDPNNHPGSFALGLADRFEFLARIVKEGKVKQFTAPFAGLLNKYNRTANAMYTFLYREILWGGYAGNNALIKTAVKIFEPFKDLLRNSGFGDETLLMGAVEKWGFVKFLTGIGTKFSGLGANPTIATSVVAKTLTKFLSPVVLKSLGFILSNSAGIVTGGISYILAAVGDVVWNFTSKILQGKFSFAFKSSWEMLMAKLRTVSRVVLGIVLGGCSCFIIPMIFVIGIIAMMAPMEPSTGGGAYSDVISSKKFQVTKTARQVSNGSGIEYTITIRNITDTAIDEATNAPNPIPLNIDGFTDTLLYSKSCASGGGIVEVTSDATYGKVALPNLGDLPSRTIQPGQILTLPPFILENILTTDGTYLNNIEVTVEEDPGKKGEASVSTKFGAGGCSVCPAGWPTQPFTLTQTAYTYDSHKNAEALDMASGIGQAIKATHNGTAFRGDDPDGYGHYVKVISPLGFATIYGHMSSIAVSTGQQIEANQIIGEMGTSGNSTGPHLHYEFVNTSVECLGPGKPLRLIRYSDTPEPGSYIPENVPKSCVGSASCNMSR